jgi:hypothetical protein
MLLTTILYLLFASLVSADTITVNSPTNNQVVLYNTDNYYSNFLSVNYQISRNGMVYLTNTTTELFDDKNNLIQSLFTNTFMYGNVSTNLQFPIIQTPQAPATLNWTVSITGFGRYLFINTVNGTTSSQIQFVNLVNNIPITLNLTGTNQADTPTNTSTSPPTTPSMPTLNSSSTKTSISLMSLFVFLFLI